MIKRDYLVSYEVYKEGPPLTIWRVGHFNMKVESWFIPKGDDLINHAINGVVEEHKLERSKVIIRSLSRLN